MDKRKLKHFKQRLLDERTRILRDLNQNEDEFESDASRSAEFEETAKVDRDKEYISGILSNEADILTEIEEALKRIENGTYGICIDSGQEIPEARLDFMPWAPRCREAQEAYERKRRASIKFD